MKKPSLIAITALALLVGSGVASAQPAPHKVYDRERGELSIGTQIPTRGALVQVMEDTLAGNSGATRLMALLEYGERLACYECVPLAQRLILESDDARVREFSAWWVRRRTFAIGAVIQQLKAVLAADPDDVRRSRAAEALGEFLEPKSVASLSAAATGDSSALVRTRAVSALGRLNHPAGNAVIAQAMSDAEVAVRRAAMDAVLRVNFFRDADALLGRLADDDARIRMQAARLLGEFRVSEAVPALGGLLLGDPAFEVRQAAAWGLGRIGGAEARAALGAATTMESEPLVLDAIEIALAM